METERSLSPQIVCAALNRLICACEDDVLALGRTAGVARSASDRDALEACSGERAMFIRELRTLVKSHSGVARRGGSFGERVWTLARSARALLVGVDEGDAYHACARLEAATEGAYAKALLMRLPNDARTVVERQHEAIARDSAYLRRKSFVR